MIWTSTADLIITGLDTKHHSYARAVVSEHQDEDAPPGEPQTLEEQLVQFLTSKNIYLQREHISACHSLRRKDNKTKMIVVQFANQKHEVDEGCKKPRGTWLYVNEHLTKKNAEIAGGPGMEKCS